MHDGIALSPVELAALRMALGAFESRDRSRGLTYQSRGAVRALRPLDLENNPDASVGFEADVLGSQLYTVEWLYVPRVGWESSCSCPVEIRCKHAYAAAQHLMLHVAGRMGTGPVQGAMFAVEETSRPAMASSEASRLIAVLEQRHGRALNKVEIGFVKKLEHLWLRHRFRGSIQGHELVDLGLVDRAGRYTYDPNPVIRDWWTEPLGSPLDLWQYLAYFAERENRPPLTLMVPLTDTSLVRARIGALERQRLVAHWEGVFRQAPETPRAAVQVVVVPEVRLRLASPKLIWEYRSAPDAPWRAVKGGLVRQWFAAIADNPAGAPPSTLALLQEVQLRHYRPREDYYGWRPSTEPQTLKLDEVSTADFVAWMLANEALRSLFVNEAGESYDSGRVALVWTARPSPKNPDDVELRVTLPDGTDLPRGMVRLLGENAVGLLGRTVFEFPPALPGASAEGVQLPKEALASVRAARHLRRAGVVVRGGIELPVVELVPLFPRFECRLLEGLAEFGRAGAHILQVELGAHSADGVVGQRWNGQVWTSLAGRGVGELPRAGGKVWDLDHGRAEAAIPFLDALRLSWAGATQGWRRAVTKSFPDEFAAWAEDVRATGAEIACDPELAGLVRPPDRARVELAVSDGGEGGAGIDWFDLQLVVRAEDTALTDEEVALLLKARGRFVLLKGKGWRRLELALDEGQAGQLEELGLDASALEDGAQRQRFHALQLADERIAGLLPEQHAARVRERAAGMRAIAPPAPPAGLTAELRPYQHEGFHFLAHLATNGLGGVLADDMGLGKTVQALAWLLWLAAGRKDGRPPRVLIVCPKSVVTNWENESRRFAATLPVATWRPKESALPESGLVVINYVQLRLAADALGAVAWDAVILDEGQNIKNPQSQTAKVARELRATHRLVLTGTPIENRVLDLWSLFAFAMPGLLGGQTAFKRAFNDKTDPLARARLGRRVRHFMLRRTKAQVAADLPPRIEEDLIVELEPAQRRLYEAELKRARQMLLGVTSAREFDTQRFNILQSLLRLRQICCDPRLLGASTDADDSAKVTALFDQLEPILAEGHKVLVFSQFVSLLELLRPELAAREIKYLTITGQTENRQELVDQFQASPEIGVFLLSLKAAGAGLNLTAASYVVLFDPWWNPAVEAQAIDRTHRIGQRNQVIAYRLLAKDTVEEKIRLLQKTKAELARAVVQEESLASVMDLEDLRYVLG